MFVISMDCLLTYNFTCVNSTYVQLNTSSIIYGNVIDPTLLNIDDNSNIQSITSTTYPISSPILVSVQHCIITSIILGGIILSTITGNILVIAAVILEKNLHSVAYYLFVSLAVADLMVATMVMPIAVLKEVTRLWVLGNIVCDIWVMIDLLCCTASILHLVAIALDRYWAITNLDYATKRTPGRVLRLICIIWMISILIASSHSFPIFRNKQGHLSGQCQIIGNVTFTIIATVGAFYIPLIGMCIIYWKIFQAAKFRIRRKAFNTNQPVTPTLTHEQHEMLSSSPTSTPNNHTDRLHSPLNHLKFFKRRHSISHQSNDIEPDNFSTYSLTTNYQNDYQLKSLKKTSSFSFLKKKSKNNYENQIHQQQTNHTIPSIRPLLTSNDLTIPINTINNPLSTPTSSPSSSPRFHHKHIIITDTNNTMITKSPALSSRKKIDIKRERKATKVLGVVMGCFILCWLPFFIEETVCGIFHLTINEKIISVLTWLGYLNSMLNPVIYTIFAPDFRQAFGKILFGKYRKRSRLKK
ncbi:unnamed protein product [Rotaria sordida]|uniref:G-protein coupled receptors family 1 profile domain-containing protein n=1 Tax=Rotaria sordida TaxID=392033 RepID=A0A814PY98_9BILA|nr:unnamed protein product [Rotaria sordida]CAF1397644.1 unnamed protein product [Rotaria sordida]